MNKTITIAISTVFQDAGEATRAIEIAKGIKKYKPKNIDPRIIFLSHGSRFEQKAKLLGFDIYFVEPKMSGLGIYQDLKMTTKNFVYTKELAKQMIEGEIKAYREINPDIVVYGFWPIAGLARRMIKKEIPGICFVPLPLTENFLDILPDIPEQVRLLSNFPKPVRLWFIHNLPHFIKRRVPILLQKNIQKAAYELGWKNNLINIFDLLKADLTIVTDLPEYYDQNKLPKNVIFTGPLFFKSNNKEEIDCEVREVFDSKKYRTKVFCTLSSSGTKETLQEVIKVFTYGEGLNWDAVILSPHYSLEEARKLVDKRDGIYITDKFVPAQKINSLADIVICHGGQGTVQTAIYSGTPLVGVAMQQEQFFNLSNVESKGAGIRIPKRKWNSKNIQNAVKKIISNQQYKDSTLLLKKRMKELDGEKNIAETIWEFIESRKLCDNNT